MDIEKVTKAKASYDECLLSLKVFEEQKKKIKQNIQAIKYSIKLKKREIRMLEREAVFTLKQQLH